MARVHVYSLPNGRAAIIRLAPKPAGSAMTDAAWEAFALAKTRFELTRPRTRAGMAERFNPANPAHTARANSLAVTPMDDATDLPQSRAGRDNWRVQGNRVVVSATPLPPLPAPSPIV